MIALPVGMVVGIIFLAAGTSGPHGVYWHSDGPSFLGVARNPFGSGHGFPGDPLAQGVAYRFGRVLLPLAGWILALGRTSRVPVMLAVAYVGSFVAMVALAAEHLRRAGRRPVLALGLLLLPFVLLWLFAIPTVIVEPLAIALVLYAYLADREERSTTRARVAAAAAILARETMALAFLPLAWRAWRRDGRKGLMQWAATGVPYALWSCWVRLRVGSFPFLDPASNRRDALAAPFVGWWQTLHRPFDNGQQYGMLIAVVTIAFAIAVARRAQRNHAIAAAALITSLSAIGYGWSVWQYPSEALRVLGPAQVLLAVAALTTCRPSTTRDDDVDVDVSSVLDLRESSRTTPASLVVDLTHFATEDRAPAS